MIVCVHTVELGNNYTFDHLADELATHHINLLEALWQTEDEEVTFHILRKGPGIDIHTFAVDEICGLIDHMQEAKHYV